MVLANLVCERFTCVFVCVHYPSPFDKLLLSLGVSPLVLTIASCACLDLLCMQYKSIRDNVVQAMLHQHKVGCKLVIYDICVRLFTCVCICVCVRALCSDTYVACNGIITGTINDLRARTHTHTLMAYVAHRRNGYCSSPSD
jgi:hypothetical protein